MSWQVAVRKTWLWPLVIAGLVVLMSILKVAPSSEPHLPAVPGVAPAAPNWLNSAPATSAAPNGVAVPHLLSAGKSEGPAGTTGWSAPEELLDFFKSRDSNYLTPHALQKLKRCAAECIEFLSAATAQQADNSALSMALLSWLAAGRNPGAFVALAAVSGKLERLDRLPREHQDRLDTLAHELATSTISLERQDWSELAKLERIGDIVGLGLSRRLTTDPQSQGMVLALISTAATADAARSLLRLGEGDLWFEALGDSSVRSNPLALQASLEQLAGYHQSDWLTRLQNLSTSSEPNLVNAAARAWASAQLSGERLDALDHWLATANLDASSLRLADTLLQFAEDQEQAAAIRARRGVALLRQ